MIGGSLAVSPLSGRLQLWLFLVGLSREIEFRRRYGVCPGFPSGWGAVQENGEI